jgi:hypothetical protein
MKYVVFCYEEVNWRKSRKHFTIHLHEIYIPEYVMFDII